MAAVRTSDAADNDDGVPYRGGDRIKMKEAVVRIRNKRRESAAAAAQHYLGSSSTCSGSLEQHATFGGGCLLVLVRVLVLLAACFHLFLRRWWLPAIFSRRLHCAHESADPFEAQLFCRRRRRLFVLVAIEEPSKIAELAAEELPVAVAELHEKAEKSKEQADIDASNAVTKIYTALKKPMSAESKKIVGLFMKKCAEVRAA